MAKALVCWCLKWIFGAGLVCWQGWAAYDLETCYPLLLQIQWPPSSINWLKIGLLGLLAAIVGPRIGLNFSLLGGLLRRGRARPDSSSADQFTGREEGASSVTIVV